MRTRTQTIVRGPIRLTVTTRTPAIVGYRTVTKYVYGRPVTIRVPIFG